MTGCSFGIATRAGSGDCCSAPRTSCFCRAHFPSSDRSRSIPPSTPKSCSKDFGTAARRSKRCCSTRRPSPAWATSTRTNHCTAPDCGRIAPRAASAASRCAGFTHRSVIRSRSRFAIAAHRSIPTATHGARSATSRSRFSSTAVRANRASHAAARLPWSDSRAARPSSARVASVDQLQALRPRLVAAAALAVAYVALTMAIAAGMFDTLDKQVQQGMSGLWSESLHAVFQAIAELGSLELTTLLMLALAIFLLRRGFGADAWVVLAFIAAQVLEVLYKANLHHPGPPPTVAHTDGPSITELVAGTGPLANSFPSGHMVRAVIAYGLIAFVVQRLAPWPLARTLAIPIATVIIVLVAFDRLYLDVHWESDVLGGLLLGGIGLLAGTIWLDRPLAGEN